MLTNALLLTAAAALTQPVTARTASASMSVGATVVRPEPQPVVALERGAVVVRNAGDAIVTIEGDPRRTASGTVFVTLTY